MTGWVFLVGVVIATAVVMVGALVWACLVVAGDADRRAEQQAEDWQYLERLSAPDDTGSS